MSEPVQLQPDETKAIFAEAGASMRRVLEGRVGAEQGELPRQANEAVVKALQPLFDMGIALRREGKDADVNWELAQVTNSVGDLVRIAVRNSEPLQAVLAQRSASHRSAMAGYGTDAALEVLQYAGIRAVSGDAAGITFRREIGEFSDHFAVFAQGLAYVRSGGLGTLNVAATQAVNTVAREVSLGGQQTGTLTP